MEKEYIIILQQGSNMMVNGREIKKMVSENLFSLMGISMKGNG